MQTKFKKFYPMGGQMLKLSQNHPHKLRLRRAKPLARVQLGVYVQLRHTTKKEKRRPPVFE